MDAAAFALTIGASFFWGLSMDMNKLCAGKVNATTFNSLQYLAMAAVMTPLALLTGVSFGSPWAIALAVAYGVLWPYLGSQMFFYCVECAPAYVVVPISNTSAIWGVVFPILLLGEGIGWEIPVSLAFVVAGMLLMSPKREPGRKSSTLAIVLAALVAAIFGLTYVVRKAALTEGMAPLTMIWVAALTGLSLLGLTGLVRGSFRGQKLDRYSVGVGASAGILNQLAGGGLYLLALGIEQASSLAPVTSSTIPFGFLLAIPLLRERPTRKSVLGVAIIFIGVVIATL